MKAYIVVITGPSGVGKQTIINKLQGLLDKQGIGYVFSVSHTTRLPREGEENGVHYHFVTKKEFDGMLEWQSFLEHAEVHQNSYGTAVKPVCDALEQGKMVIMDIDVQGAEKVRSKVVERKLNHLDIFIAPPEPYLQNLETRLRERGSESEEAIQCRLGNAQNELNRIGEFNFVVINDVVDDAAQRCFDFILRKIKEEA